MSDAGDSDYWDQVFGNKPAGPSGGPTIDQWGNPVKPPGYAGGGPRLVNTPSTYANPTIYDPQNPTRTPFATPQGGQLTPYSSSGTPAPGIRPAPPAPLRLTGPGTPGAGDYIGPQINNPGTPTGQSLTIGQRPPFAANQPQQPNVFGGLPIGGAALTGVGALAGAPTDYGAALNKRFNESVIGGILNRMTGYAGQGGGLPDVPVGATPPQTQTGTQTTPNQITKVNIPPYWGDQPPPIGPRAPPPPYFPPRPYIPAYLPQNANRTPAMQRPGGGGGGGAPPAPSMINLQPQPSQGEYFATTGNARTPVWQPGGFASPPAPHFQTPLTPMFGPGQWLNQQQRAPAPAAAPGNARAPMPQMPVSPNISPGGSGSPQWVPGPAPPNTRNVWAGGTPGTNSPYDTRPMRPMPPPAPGVIAQARPFGNFFGP